MKFIKTIFLRPSVFLMGCILVANIINLIYNAYLGRVLSFETFGALTLLLTIIYLAQLIWNAIGGAVNERTSYLVGQGKSGEATEFTRVITQKVTPLFLGASAVWLVTVPLSSQFFQIQDPGVLLSFTLILVPGLLATINRSYLQGQLAFVYVGLSMFLESISRLILAVLLVLAGLPHLVYTSVFISQAIGWLVAWVFLRNFKLRAKDYQFHFPKKFVLAGLISGFSTMAYLTIDVMMVKHYLPPTDAGAYALLSLVGKMIYFFGSILNGFTLTLVSRAEGMRRNSTTVFYKIFAGVVVCALLGVVFLGGLGHIFVPMLFRVKAQIIVPFLLEYTLAIALLTLAATITSFHLAKYEYRFAVIGFISAALLVGGLMIFHTSVGQIVDVVLATACLYFVLSIVMHLVGGNGRFILRNLIDFIGAFTALPQVVHETKKERILIFNWRDLKHRYAGGAEVYLHELAKRWVARGHPVTLFCGNDGHCLRYEVVEGIEIIRRGGFYTVYVWAFLYYLLKFRGNFDIILDSQNGIPFFTPLYASEKIFCVMYHVHQRVFIRSLIWPLARLATFLEKHVMPWAYRDTRFMTISRSTKQEMQKLGLGKKGIDIVHPGIDQKLFTPGTKATRPTILYMGRLKAYKGIDTLIRAAHHVTAILPQTKFIIAGEGEEQEALKKLVQKLKLGKWVTFKGRVTEKQKQKLYQAAWLAVNPSLIEGWGITSIEANASGTPVIAANVPGLRDSVKNPHTGYLVEYGNPQQFAQRIAQLVTEHAQRKRMEKEARLWAKKFDWDIAADKALGILTARTVAETRRIISLAQIGLNPV